MSQKTLKTMKQYNSQDIYGIFSEGFEQGFFKRVGTARDLDTYIGKDDKGRYAFKFKGQYVPTRIFGSEVISVEQYEDDNSYSLIFLLEKEELLERFCTFCQDLLSSLNGITDQVEAIGPYATDTHHGASVQTQSRRLD